MRNKIIALGLGSNLQIPMENLRRALAELRKNRLFRVLTASSIYETDALLPPNAPADWNQKFLNAAVLCEVTADLPAESILREVKDIEKKMGRTDTGKWGPRIIDIDLLFWSAAPYRSEAVTIPHPRLTERPFALLPLLELWPRAELARPAWSRGWAEERPLNAQRSRRHFWPRMVGILNVTTDSFSDGGRFMDAENLSLQMDKLVNQGVEIIDIGAESTRPQAVALPPDQEYNNLNWALAEIKKQRPHLPVSLDCRRPQVARRLLEKYSLDYLNDVSGFASPEMRSLLLESGLSAFVMHSLTIPPTADHTLDPAQNPCFQLVEWWKETRQTLLEAAVPEEKLIFDPGIGFGKTPLQSLYILRHLEELYEVREPIMVAHSRKSYLNLITHRLAPERDLETALITQQLNPAFTQYLRVHDVETQLLAMRSRPS